MLAAVDLPKILAKWTVLMCDRKSVNERKHLTCVGWSRSIKGDSPPVPKKRRVNTDRLYGNNLGDLPMKKRKEVACAWI